MTPITWPSGCGSPAGSKCLPGSPLVERQAMARQMRSQSEARKRSGMDYGDVGPQRCPVAGDSACAHR
jgi:hypothetical protein